jgi:hypothetical protein
MQFFYDGQIRRYLVQTIRLLSNFVVKFGDGRLSKVPVMYGDMDRQVANLIKQNSENKINGAPRIAVYITGLQMDKERLADPTYVGKIHIRERAVENGVYTTTEGSNYTVERLMPSPYTLTVKADIWATNTEQKLQILEQILMLFNPSLEIQTTDNYIDWTSLSVVYLDQVDFSNRQIPVGNDTPIDIASLTFSMPIWISPPSKVKKLGVVSSIIMTMYNNSTEPAEGYLEGFVQDPNEGSVGLYDQIPSPIAVEPLPYNIIVFNGQAKVFSPTEKGHLNFRIRETGLDSLNPVNWYEILDKYPNAYRAGESKIFLLQSTGFDVVGTIAVNPLDSDILDINWDSDTYPSNTDITTSNRTSPGTFDAIIDPTETGPNSGLPIPTPGTRYLIINNIGGGLRETLIAEVSSNRIDTTIDFDRVRDIEVFVNNTSVSYKDLNIDGKLVLRLLRDAEEGDIITYIIYVNDDGPDAWKNLDGSDFIANANDLIEWNGSNWAVVFDSTNSSDIIRYQTNITTNVQYKWDGITWVKSFEGEYRKGSWRLVL